MTSPDEPLLIALGAFDPVAFALAARNWILGAVLILLAVPALVDLLGRLGIRTPFITSAMEKAELRRFQAFLDAQEARELAKVRTYVDTVFRQEHAFVANHEKQLVNLNLSQLGLSHDQLPQLRAEITRMAQIPTDSPEKRADAVRRLSASTPVLLDTRGIDRPLYREVRWYINFADAMFDPTIGPLLATLMANHIRDNLAPDALARAVIVAPRNGNLLFAAMTAEKLRRPIIFLREQPRIREDQVWDGVLPTDGHLVLVHDVAVSGRQLVEAQRLLAARGHRCHELFCLVDRTPAVAKDEIAAEGLDFRPITAVSDEDIERLRI
ncbi:MAG TPA: hypothetical protein VF559_03005 [Caulobacteraceae bacterium]|jgi:orotate phosphoribosyltransferase